MSKQKTKWAIILDFSTLELILLSLSEFDEELEYDEVLAIAEDQNLISNSSDCQIMITEGLNTKSGILKKN